MEEIELKNVRLALFFTSNVGLKTWADTGNLGRELAIYRKLARCLSRVDLLTYGGEADYQYAAQESELVVNPLRWHRFLPLTAFELLSSYWRVVVSADVWKTNQLQGSELPVLLKRFFPSKKLVVRCGWLCSSQFEQTDRCARDIEFVRRIERKAFAAADMVVVTTQFIKQQVIDRYAVIGDKIRVIPNYVDTELFLPVDYSGRQGQLGQPWRICYIGRLSAEKNLDALFYAVQSCQQTMSRPIRLDLYGGGPQVSLLKELAARLHIDAVFHGSVPNDQLPAALCVADLFVLPSFGEGHPKSLLEAMSCGVPCLGTDVCGIKDLLRHQETGILCGTDYLDIAAAMQSLLADDVLRARLGANARRYIVENFSLEKVFRMELDMLQQVIGA